MRASSGGIGKRREQCAGTGTKGQCPSQRSDQQSQVAGVTDDGIDAGRDQRVSRLNADQPAEAVPEDKDRPEPQRSPGRKENHAEPAHGVAVDYPEPIPVRPGRQPAPQQPDHRKNRKDPAVPAILAHPGTDISACEERNGPASRRINLMIGIIVFGHYRLAMEKRNE
jgi:hypothetical protein